MGVIALSSASGEILKSASAPVGNTTLSEGKNRLKKTWKPKFSMNRKKNRKKKLKKKIN